MAIKMPNKARAAVNQRQIAREIEQLRGFVPHGRDRESTYRMYLQQLTRRSTTRPALGSFSKH
ncbi:MAG TPA: hypothetical protein VK009_21785 [Chloroflexota bacterium]|nr:hypothetical protein [Chloroflexota bacterium]